MIHYHGTPLSGDKTTKMALRGHHACVSFARPDDVTLVAEVCQSFILDNGAYNSWRNGTAHDRLGFMEWASRWLKHPGCDWALIPDLIDGHPLENDSLLQLVGKEDRPKWVPVWHLHEPIERLERLCDDWPRVALGSSGEFAEVGSVSWWRRISEAMNAICDDEGRPPCKLHGLRMLDPTIFSWIPLSGADSSNVARNIGLDVRWRGPYMPASQQTRALILMERIESHAAAATWNAAACDTARNFELLG